MRNRKNEKRWSYYDSDLDAEEAIDLRLETVTKTVEEAIKMIGTGTWGDLRKIVERAEVTRAELVRAIESLNLSGVIGVEQRGSLERLHYIPSADDDTKNRLYGQKREFYRSWRKTAVVLG